MSGFAKVGLALAAVHAARSGAIRRLQLDDLDIGNRKLTVDGRVRPLDEPTLQVDREWLDFRRRRWPDTANPHLLINKITALGTGSISQASLTAPLRGQAATLEQLHVDRQLEEASSMAPIRSTSPRSSAWTRRPRSATRTPHGRCWSSPSNKPVRTDRGLLPFCLSCPHEIEDCPGTARGH
ncbi:hypothetical protein GCM10027073_38890 [Streptomyces chlorus]|uniref:Integrase n=1 Tax=Streptomyces chlorus TaxID=887452 RepID=A0ABW1E9S8_9ACTN